MYRYVDSVDDLRRLVVCDILDSTFAYMAEARDRYDDPEDRITASSAAFRTWALCNPREFRLAFTYAVDPVDTLDESEMNTPQRVGVFFAPLFVELLKRTKIEIPQDINESYRHLATSSSIKRRHLQLAGDDSPGLIWLFQYCWTRLYGIVALEAFGQVEHESVVSGVFFRTTMLELSERLGFTNLESAERVLDAEIGCVGPQA